MADKGTPTKDAAKEQPAKEFGAFPKKETMAAGGQPEKKTAFPPKKEDAAKEGQPLEEENEISALAAKLSALSDSMLRLQAEFDNYKKRTAKEKEQLSRQSEAKLMLKFIPAYEELQLAEKEAQKIPDEPLRKGVLLVLGKLRSSFEKEGLQEMRLEGEKFDPFRHEAAMHEPSLLPEGSIVRVIKKGYTMRGEMLQHAIVSVSSGKEKDNGKKDEAKKE